jgi:hypothetical protein
MREHPGSRLPVALDFFSLYILFVSKFMTQREEKKNKKT